MAGERRRWIDGPQVTEARSPLKRTEKATAFKLYESDTGMLASRYPGSTARAVYLDMKTPTSAASMRTWSHRNSLPSEQIRGTTKRVRSVKSTL